MTTPQQLTVAATQFASTPDPTANVDKAEALVRQAAAAGAHVILLQELFETPYFCIDENAANLAFARPREGNPLLHRMAALAAELGVVLPVSFFEQANRAYFNSLAVIDADGTFCGVYRKTHIPGGKGYHEKYYFNPGDTGFRVFDTRYARLGCAICWDQWFPESARVLALRGADILCYPSAIGSEPEDPGYDSCGHWTRVMQGHAAANLTPLIASNRIGTEQGTRFATTFYGSSFITDCRGEIVARASRDDEEVISATLDLEATAQLRREWRFFRDRRPEHYEPLMGLRGD